MKEAFEALSRPSASDRKEANAWLVDFEKSPQAWTVAHTLLLEPPGSPCRFFGANIFHNKIRHDMSQLNAGR